MSPIPTYRFSCDTCGGAVEQWLSIHHAKDERPTVHVGCGGELALVITGVRTYGVGDRGAPTLAADKREKQIDLDRPAYKRLRDEGHQPTRLHGSHRLEALAANNWEIKTGGLVSVPENRETELNEMMADAAAGEWSPIEEVHQRRKKVGIE